MTFSGRAAAAAIFAIGMDDVGREDRVRRDSLDVLEEAVLQREVFEHGLDDDVAAFEAAVVRRARDARHLALRLGAAHAPARHALAVDAVDGGEAAREPLVVAIL